MTNPQDLDIPTYDGLKLKATFFSVGPQKPCIILSSGFAGLRQHFLPDFAARFNAAGYGAIAYDNRCWGESEGLPRDEVDPWLQTRDYLDVFNFVAAHPDVDPSRVVYWGSSLSGGNVICAAAMNHRLAAVIAQVPFISGESIARLPGNSPDLISSNRRPNSDLRIPVFPTTLEEVLDGSTKAVLKDPGAIPFLDEVTGRGWDYAKSCTLQSLSNAMFHEPLAYVHRISPTPLLMVVADNDVTTQTHLQFQTYEKALQPKELRILKGAGHFSPYYGDCFEQNVSFQLEFLKGVLG